MAGTRLKGLYNRVVAHCNGGTNQWDSGGDERLGAASVAELLEGLTASQQEAVQHIEGP